MIQDRALPKFAAAVKDDSLWVEVARTARQRRDAYRLRYDVYIAEQGKGYREADHDDRLLIDELDRDAAILLVSKNGEAVGTLRCNWFTSAAVERCYSDSLQRERFAVLDGESVAICSRLAVRCGCRDQRVRSLLFDTIYRTALERATLLCFATCAPSLLRMFRGYGFREYAVAIEDPVVGRLHRTLLVLDDLAHLDRVNSPFLEIARRIGLPAKERSWLKHIFDEYRAIPHGAR